MDLLERLALRKDTHVVILSGKEVSKLEELFEGAPTVSLMGDSDAEISVGDEVTVDKVAKSGEPAVQRVIRYAKKRAKRMRIELGPNTIRDQKIVSASMHNIGGKIDQQTWKRFRQGVIKRARRERNLLAVATDHEDKELNVTVKGAPDKGTAIQSYLEEKYAASWREKVTAIFVGDSGGPGEADEPGFRVMAENGAAGVLVGPPTPGSAAQYRAYSVEDVERFLTGSRT